MPVGRSASKRLIAIALAALVGAIAVVLVWDGPATRSPSVATTIRDKAEHGAYGVEPAADRSTKRLAVSVADSGVVPSPAESTGPQEQASIDATGGIAGSILDSNGQPIPSAELSISRGPSSFSESGESRRVRSDAEGYFLATGLRPGDWSVSFAGTRGNETVGRGRSLGQVLVIAGRVIPADFALEGDRSVSGAFTVADDSGIMLRVDLFLDSNPRVHVAETWLFDEEVAAEGPTSADTLKDPEDPDGIRRSRRIPGAFRFEGLIPGAYTLRVVIGTAEEGGDELYLERQVNLLDHDVDLPAEDLTWEEFIRAAMSRKSGAGAESVRSQEQD